MSKVSTREKPPRNYGPRVLFRYVSPEHHELVRKCAHAAGLSINAWLCQISIRAARREAERLAEQTSIEV